MFYIRRIKQDLWPIHDFKGVSVRSVIHSNFGRPEHLERTGLGRRLSTRNDTWFIGSAGLACNTCPTSLIFAFFHVTPECSKA